MNIQLIVNVYIGKGGKLIYKVDNNIIITYKWRVINDNNIELVPQ